MFTKLVPTEHLSHYAPLDGHFLLGFGTPWVKIFELWPYTETVRPDDSLREAEKCWQENMQWTSSMPGPRSSPHLRSWNSVDDPNMRENPLSPGKLSGLLTLSSQSLGGNFPFVSIVAWTKEVALYASHDSSQSIQTWQTQYWCCR